MFLVRIFSLAMNLYVQSTFLKDTLALPISSEMFNTYGTRMCWLFSLCMYCIFNGLFPSAIYNFYLKGRNS